MCKHPDCDCPKHPSGWPMCRAAAAALGVDADALACGVKASRAAYEKLPSINDPEPPRTLATYGVSRPDAEPPERPDSTGTTK